MRRTWSVPCLSFNSRTREGCDRKPSEGRELREGFNSRTREGCDMGGGRAGADSLRFQFTHPRGVRHRPLIPRATALHVSIHAPARGATSPLLPAPCLQEVSIHAPARGATGGRHSPAPPGTVSIHAPARGATVLPYYALLYSVVSIHAPARGATAGVGRRLWGYLYRPALAKVLKLSLLSGAAST